MQTCKSSQLKIHLQKIHGLGIEGTPNLNRGSRHCLIVTVCKIRARMRWICASEQFSWN